MKIPEAGLSSAGWCCHAPLAPLAAFYLETKWRLVGQWFALQPMSGFCPWPQIFCDIGHNLWCLQREDIRLFPEVVSRKKFSLWLEAAIRLNKKVRSNISKTKSLIGLLRLPKETHLKTRIIMDYLVMCLAPTGGQGVTMSVRLWQVCQEHSQCIQKEIREQSDCVVPSEP